MTVTQEAFKDFIIRSGLTKKFIALNVLKTKQYVITKWLAEKTILFPHQQKKLDDFCTDFCENNQYMKEEN